MLVITALVLTVVIQCFGQDILMIFGASSNTISYAWDYMKIYSLGTCSSSLLWVSTLSSTPRLCQNRNAHRDHRRSLQHYSGPYFIFALGMGVQGAALATILSQGISCAWILRFLTGKTNHTAAAAPVRPSAGLGHPPLHRLGHRSLYHAVYREHPEHLL